MRNNCAKAKRISGLEFLQLWKIFCTLQLLGTLSGMGDWQKEMTANIGREVLKLREQRGFTLLSLEKRTEKLGNKIGRGAISQLETGKRNSISVAELLVLAAALDVPPALLLFPKYPYGRTEYLPDEYDSAIRAHDWLSGRAALSDLGGKELINELGDFEPAPEGIFIVYPGSKLIQAAKDLQDYNDGKSELIRDIKFETFEGLIEWDLENRARLEDNIKKLGGDLGESDEG